jgi:hypothetical protein
MTADVECCAEDGARSSSPEGAFEIPDATLAFGSAKPVLDAPIDAELTHNKLTFAPVPLNLGAPQPAILTGESDERGYQLRLTGPVLRSDLLAFGKALPQFGDGLESALPEAKDEPEVDAAPEAPIRVDLTATRSWFGGQTWTSAAAKPVSAKRSARRHR